MSSNVVLTTDFPDLKLINRGKVRDIYDLGVLVAAIATVSIYINNDVKEKARRKTEDWFDC